MKRMLFNATQQEELRVAIVDGQKLIDIDIETTGREQRKSNIYKGVITRIEPSLEACFVNYGEDRHGFLPFKEVARSYFRDGVDVRNATIKDALREGQEIMVQVEKEERGNKGAALTSFISLAGRYLVLMPNNPRGGGVSRRVEGEDRQELRETMDKLDLPSGMSVIARTAGIGRNVEELQWDLNYLMQLWRAIEGAGQSAPGAFLIYQESSLVIRAIRDYFQPDIGEILIDTDDIYEQAQQFMSHVMPDMVHRVKRYRDDVPLFSRFQIEHQIETAYSRTVPLPSGGAIVIDHTEALVSVDVNSARATRGSDIETTAFNTNLEAAEEVARQLRLRDLGGLIVIDFIDMENTKNQREVETRLKDALHFDRARVQMGKISRFGLMELSRQRLRPSLSDGSHVTCPRCNGTGHIRDTESSALQVLRIIQEEAMKENSAAIHVQAPVDVAAFLLNEKRGEILKVETRHRVSVILIPNKHLETPHYKMERIKHDDPRLEDNQASYLMAEEIETDISYGQRQKEEVKPRQEAMVKGITPDQPAPIVERKPVAEAPAPAPAAPAVEEGFLSKLFGLFKKKPVAPPPAPVVEEKAQPSRERTERNGGRNQQRNRQRGRGRDREERDVARADGRENREESGRNAAETPAAPAQPGRPPKPPREPREPREAREGREPREAKEGREPRVEAREGGDSSRRERNTERNADRNAERTGERAQRGAQGGSQREERKEASATQPAEDLAARPINAASIVDAQAAVLAVAPEQADVNELSGDQSLTAGAAESGEGSEEQRRRRRRRGGRNRNRRDKDGELIEAGGDLEAIENGTQDDDAGIDAHPAAELPGSGFPAAPAAVAVSTVEVIEAMVATTETPVIAPQQTRPVDDLPIESQPAGMSSAYSTPAAPEAPSAPAAPSAPSMPSTAEIQAKASGPSGLEAPAAPSAPAPLTAPVNGAANGADATAHGSEPAARQPVHQAPAPAGVRAAASGNARLEDFQEMLGAAGLTLAVTDPDKLKAAQDAAAQVRAEPRIPRVRKPLPPVSNEPLVQVETNR